MKNPQPSEAGGKHYGKVDPFVLTRAMESSGNAHVDSCRCNVIKYGFRMKGKGDDMRGKLIDDLRKAAHYAQEAIDTLTAEMLLEGQEELPFAEVPERDETTCPICHGGPASFFSCNCPK